MRALASLFALLSTQTVMAQWTPYAGTILINGSVVTVDEGANEVEPAR